MEINRIHIDAPLGNHISRNRRIDSTGQKQHALAVCTKRQPARSRNDLGINTDPFTDFNKQLNLRLMHIHTELRKCIQNRCSKLCIELHGIQRIIFSRPARKHLEGLMLVRIDRIHIIYNVLCKLIKALILQIHNRTDPGHAKYCFQVLYRFFIVKFRQRIHIDPALRFIYFKSTVASAKCILDLIDQCILKQITVLALNTDLGIFDQKSCEHSLSHPTFCRHVVSAAACGLLPILLYMTAVSFASSKE